jgi:hypothetical protein
MQMPKRLAWVCWSGLSMAMFSYLFYSLYIDKSSARQVFLPGETTHGHYQIEMACSACHTPSLGVQQDACLKCHAEELKRANDTHPPSKFNDPTNAERLAVLDARSCVTCHREHVPARTHPMGLSLPTDYCFHCHRDIEQKRPSHAGLAFTSCASAGCHNYHDNTALYENFLAKHFGQPSVHDPAVVPLRSADAAPKDEASSPKEALTEKDHDAFPHVQAAKAIVSGWAETAHARVGVNCTGCHAKSDAGASAAWSDSISHQICGTCHGNEVQGFLGGKHGMRLALGLSPMSPQTARLPMKPQAAHQELNCVSCHQAHRFDTRHAAVTACLSCHNDRHSLAYERSTHARLWQDETSGKSPPGSGVSCATCHLPREVHDGGRVRVQHNQNDNLRPNEKMVRSVCMHCHGLEFSLDALADRALIDRCFDGQPSLHIDSARMAKEWFARKEREAYQRKSKESSASSEANPPSK